MFSGSCSQAFALGAIGLGGHLGALAWAVGPEPKGAGCGAV